MSDVIVAFTIPAMFAWFAWLIFTTVRRYKIAKLQAEVQSKLLEKIGSAQDLLAYAQTDTGRQLLESLQVERSVSEAPHGKILWALQVGTILFFFGAGALWVRTHVSAHGFEGFTILGALSIALGLGFLFSGAASYYMSKSFGLLNRTRS
jgi:hypothetical protein